MDIFRWCYKILWKTDQKDSVAKKHPSFIVQESTCLNQKLYHLGIFPVAPFGSQGSMMQHGSAVVILAG